ncbi:MAG: hypothetical protein IJA94_01145 [Bacilli bacterium]|nr:hypothetical protein [Bacilli bacterium]
MFPNISSQGLSITKVLTGISKTLNVANQIIPIYNQAKPMINNAKNILAVLKDINVKPNKNNNSSIKKSQPVNNTQIKKTDFPLTNEPVFFT